MNEPSAWAEILGCLLFFAVAGGAMWLWEAIIIKFCRAGRARVARYEARVSKTGKVE